ncbi:hypothetical protein LC653_45885 [Nostoc sp. CHAB 5784]|uniref:hypothetical protein n=1 Tax=Nostoc mirabile TaxID=2907820 RepID=UPI001E373DA4|nr:hypothetical protein [Nostoc mirabile]MCC5670890.1 hypothetical protein [Nostoc mirabile CHAB5784]
MSSILTLVNITFASKSLLLYGQHQWQETIAFSEDELLEIYTPCDRMKAGEAAPSRLKNDFESTVAR